MDPDPVKWCSVNKTSSSLCMLAARQVAALAVPRTAFHMGH